MFKINRQPSIDAESLLGHLYFRFYPYIPLSSTKYAKKNKKIRFFQPGRLTGGFGPRRAHARLRRAGTRRTQRVSAGFGVFGRAFPRSELLRKAPAHPPGHYKLPICEAGGILWFVDSG